MFLAKKWFFSLAIVVAAVGGVLLSQAGVARAERESGVLCVMDVVVESRNQSGTVVGTETYHQEFVLQEGASYFDDFSTRTRFKFFSASLQKNNGESTVAINWFADVTVFNSVDFNTSVILADGQKSGKVAGNNTVYTSSGSTTTNFSLSAVEN
jgi:hypothetical protein